MKTLPVLIMMLALASWTGIQAQSAAPTDEKKTNRITITTTKVDESGKPVTETWIAEGQSPELILQGMAIDPEVLKKVEVAPQADNASQERLFLIRHAGEKITIEGTLGQPASDPVTGEKLMEGQHQAIIITRDGEGNQEYKKISTWSSDGNHAKAYYRTTEPENKSNCAALGVYVHNDGENMGCNIRSLIDQGGAQAAGLKEGDNILSIDEYDISDFQTLHQALANFFPGDEVVVRFEREGKKSKVRVHLTSWAEIPTHAWRARSDCDRPTPDPIEIDTEEDPQLSGTTLLQLEDAVMYPNPTEGRFALSFTTEPGQLSISITDVSGKVVYQEVNDNSTGYYKREIDISEVPTGNYVLSVKQGSKVYTQQLSKQ